MKSSGLRVNLWQIAVAISVVALVATARLGSALLAYHNAEEARVSDYSNPMQGGFAVHVARELRLSIADLFWLKTEEYIHDGVQHRPHGEGDEFATTHQEQSEHVHTEECDHTHEDEEYDAEGIPLKQDDSSVVGLAHDCEDHGGTLIPSRQSDFRGFLGDLERQTQPYSPEHHLSADPQELLPWLRLATLSNPHHIRAYRGIAFFLATYLKRPAQAIQVIQDALVLNTDHPQLLLVLGRLHFYERKDPVAASKYFERVIELWKEDSNKGTWDEEDQFAVRQSFVHLAYCEMRQGNKDGAIWWCEEGMREFPDAEAVKRYRMRLLGQVPPRRNPPRDQIPREEDHLHQHDAGRTDH
ncbi:MAG TPA: hypothetical protein PKH07_05105 [bacterium]|nr:hypothetical protein [bacterium]